MKGHEACYARSADVQPACLQTQLALVTLKTSRQSCLVPDLLVPDGWSTVVLCHPCILYKVVS